MAKNLVLEIIEGEVAEGQSQGGFDKLNIKNAKVKMPDGRILHAYNLYFIDKGEGSKVKQIPVDEEKARQEKANVSRSGVKVRPVKTETPKTEVSRLDKLEEALANQGAMLAKIAAALG